MRHLNAFYIFNTVAHSSSYSQAASRLSITHGAVSKQIATLEDYLQQKLFVKRGRKMCLTKEGEILASYTNQAFDYLSSAVTRLEQEKKQCLNISCEPTLSMRWLMPRLTHFQDKFNTEIRLSTAGGNVDLASAGLSMAIRRNDFTVNSNYNIIDLGDEWVGPVLSPEYWKQIEGNLTDATLIHSDTRLNAWADWFREADVARPIPSKQRSFGHFYFSIQAAIDSLGTVVGSYPLIMDEVKRGNLIAPYGFIKSGYRYVLLTKNHCLEERETQFVNWLVEQFSFCSPDLNYRPA